MPQPANDGIRTGRRSVGRALSMAAVVAAAATAAGAWVLPATAGAASATVVKTAHNKTWGTILVLGNGDTVYRLTADPADKSVCTGACAQTWPPVLLASGQKEPTGVNGLGTITRAGGRRQVTYKGIPLYLFAGDHKAGQANGNIKDTWGQWWVVNPGHPHTAPTASQASSSGAGSGGTTSTVAGSGVAY